MEYAVWLQCILGAGNGHILKILEFYHSPRNIYYTDRTRLEKDGLFTKTEIKKIKSVTLDDSKKIISECEKSGIKIITFFNEEYPECLKNICNPPLLLYVKGKLPDFDNIPSICIVGPREISEFGKKAAYSLSARLSKAGIIIVSGGAVGSDTYAHIGAIKNGGITVLVLGCGINSNYLYKNAKMRDEITKKGCLISEYPPKASAAPYNFPVRNRLMSALSLGTVVIEAGKKSGALITATHANEQGRDVFVIPGSPDKKEYFGSNSLLRDGAKPLLDASDIFNEYLPRFPDKINIEKAFEKPTKNTDNKNNKKLLDETLSKEAKIVYNHLDKQNFFPDNIHCKDITADELLSALTELEVMGYIQALPGGQYKKV